MIFCKTWNLFNLMILKYAKTILIFIDFKHVGFAAFFIIKVYIKVLQNKLFLGFVVDYKSPHPVFEFV